MPQRPWLARLMAAAALAVAVVALALGISAWRARGLVDAGANLVLGILFGRTLAESGLLASMGRRGCAYDNAACESAIASFKTELVHRRSFRSRNAAREEVFRWIEGWYNRLRLHSANGFLAPVAWENARHAA